MHMEDVGVKAHVVEVPDYIVVQAHFEGRAVGVDIAIQLRMKTCISGTPLKSKT
jgi:hypothetical protein